MKSWEFERIVCEILKKNGFWALNIPRNHTGAQPFDIIAIKRKRIVALDAKLCEKGIFALDRFEWNQRFAMELIQKRADVYAAGVVCFYDDLIHFISYDNLIKSKSKTIKLTPRQVEAWEGLIK